ncbi:MAG: 2OG-Fe(II) oxygenase [Alphaproteobacteria bacterium]|nr:2OG-Fe(II) oxygenase [Alphaproteobacteria bacterium]
MRWIKEYPVPLPSLCDELITGFKKTRELGLTNAGLSAKGVDKTWKDSEDASLVCLPHDVYATAVRAYREHVVQSLQAYWKDFPVLSQATGRLGFIEPPQIQYYKPGGGFFGAHYESSALDLGHRVLAFQTFLNDIEEGGGTYFLYQDHTVPPKKGKTVIWPAGFTHTHRGQVAPKEEKYIITGWISHGGQ